MKFNIFFLTILILVISSCNSLKSSKSKNIDEPIEIEEMAVIIDLYDVVNKNKISQDKLLTSMVMLTQQQQLGKDLYENKCANCHNLYDTKTFSAEQWKPILLRMQLEANIEDIDRENIFAYVTMQ